MGLIQKASERLPKYTAEEKKKLMQRYSPELMRSIEEGEDAIDPEDLVRQASIRRDPGGLKYLDDLSVIRATVDKPVRHPESNFDPKARFRDEDDVAEEYGRFILGVPKGKDIVEYYTDMVKSGSYPKNKADIPDDQVPTEVEYEKFFDDMHLTTDKNEKKQNSSLAASLPKLNNRANGITYVKETEENFVEPWVLRLSQQTGLEPRTITDMPHTQLLVKFVANQTRLGKIRTIFVMTAVGNRNGMLGIGIGKAAEFTDAMRISRAKAIRAMRPIPRYETRTIFGSVEAKVGAVELKLEARPPGMLPLTLSTMRTKQPTNLVFQALVSGSKTTYSRSVSWSVSPI
jgi:small subunit ribosomal protein S5